MFAARRLFAAAGRQIAKPGSQWSRLDEEKLANLVVSRLIGRPIDNLSAASPSALNDVINQIPKSVDLDQMVDWTEISRNFLPSYKAEECRSQFIRIISEKSSSSTPPSAKSPASQPITLSDKVQTGDGGKSKTQTDDNTEELERRRDILLDILSRYASPPITDDGWQVEEEIKLRLVMRIYRDPVLLRKFPRLMRNNNFKATSTEYPSTISAGLLPFATNWEMVSLIVGSRSVNECKRKWLKIRRSIEKS